MQRLPVKKMSVPAVKLVLFFVIFCFIRKTLKNHPEHCVSDGAWHICQAKC